ncbi:hypothetical protein AL073_16385 [Loktanella sp. 1ANDIMAR09]|nr:hypothetical protein AL073_16385 [Loktanella sp. 1ANDIMAR09]
MGRGGLADPSSDLRVRAMPILRQAVAQTRAARPFVRDARGARRLGKGPVDGFRRARSAPRQRSRPNPQ